MCSFSRNFDKMVGNSICKQIDWDRWSIHFMLSGGGGEGTVQFLLYSKLSCYSVFTLFLLTALKRLRISKTRVNTALKFTGGFYGANQRAYLDPVKSIDFFKNVKCAPWNLGKTGAGFLGKEGGENQINNLKWPFHLPHVQKLLGVQNFTLSIQYCRLNRQKISWTKNISENRKNFADLPNFLE